MIARPELTEPLAVDKVVNRQREAAALAGCRRAHRHSRIHPFDQRPEDSLKDGLMLGELNPCGGGDPIPLLKPRLVVGRQPSCDIALKFPNVSSRHCEFRLLNGYWYVRDLGSRNGIKVNGLRCDSHWLMPGDVISVSKHRYEVNYSPNGEAPPEAEPDPLSISLLEKAGLSRRGTNDTTRFPKTPETDRRSASQRHTIDSGTKSPPPVPDDDDDELDDDKLVWLDQ
jgi:adenylate cyclase